MATEPQTEADTAYLLARAKQERERADRSTDCRVRRSHADLAARYQKRVEEGERRKAKRSNDL